MPAQSGSATLLAYGNQGAQPSGASLLLNYDAPVIAAPSTLVRNTTQGWWVKSRTSRKPLDSRYVGVSRYDTECSVPWAPANVNNTEHGSPWVAISKRDGSRESPWGAFGEMGNRPVSCSWVHPHRADGGPRSLWGAFDEMLNEDRYGIWRASKPADRFITGIIGGYWIERYVFTPYTHPMWFAADFVTSGQAFAFPPAGVANFVIDMDTIRQVVSDAGGAPILFPSAVDSIKLNPWGVGRKVDVETIIKWIKFSRQMAPGWGVVTPGGPPQPEPGESIIIPVRSVYIVVNEILLARVDDNTVIEATQLSINFDCDSWLPTFSATIPEAARDAVMPDPTPVEVYAYINGSEFRFFVEKVARNRQFAKRSVNISGRGLACELAAPYAAAVQHGNASAMTAQQLIDAALTNTGYTQSWNITDWLVPGGVFSLHGTPADVAAHVAEASGSVLAADWALRELRMLPRYPVAPWDWAGATPEYVIPAAVAQTESLEWIERPDYNVVYVSGVQAGVLAQVKRTGSAADKPAQMVTHPLITHNDAARQRGLPILADTGRKVLMQVSTPVLESTGVIDICRLVEFADGANTRRGIVRANTVSVNFPTVRQTLTIEASA